uniref:Uncharacterized protein n=1 Tax=Romanomermis culicivorax TaxID=13658 RepID=A0A915LDG0_ROMCU
MAAFKCLPNHVSLKLKDYASNSAFILLNSSLTIDDSPSPRRYLSHILPIISATIAGISPVLGKRLPDFRCSKSISLSMHTKSSA